MEQRHGFLPDASSRPLLTDYTSETNKGSDETALMLMLASAFAGCAYAQLA